MSANKGWKFVMDRDIDKLTRAELSARCYDEPTRQCVDSDL